MSCYISCGSRSGVKFPVVEFCARICWLDSCDTDWDLWVRERTEPGGGGASEKWASYLDEGPVGRTGIEHTGDDVKIGGNSNNLCGSDERPLLIPGVPAGSNAPCGDGGACDDPGFTTYPIGQLDRAGEAACWCVDQGMVSSGTPLIFDIVVNFSGANTSCHGGGNLGQLCISYLCCDQIPSAQGGTNGDCIKIHEEQLPAIGDPDISSTSYKGTAGNYGAGDFPMPTLEIDPTEQALKCCDAATGMTSWCWVLTGARANGKKYIDRGGGRAPDKFIVPDDVNVDSLLLFEDGVAIPRHRFQALHDSVARERNVKRSLVLKGCKTCGTKNSRRKCPKCKKRKKKKLF